MRLADFILANREPILTEWEAFARTCAPAGRPMDVAALRDHADEMLLVIAADLATPQSDLAQSEKSKGRAPEDNGAPATAPEEHGAGRAQSGFTVAQMVAEFRALRASVIRLWTAAEGVLDAADIDDMIRFNEAIDQALAESILRFDRDVEHAKETFLAILGHDLRTPLGAISTSAEFLLEATTLDAEVERGLLARIAGSATRSVSMVGDLLDFTRSRLGYGIPIARADTDLTTVLRDVVDEIAAAHPQRRIAVDAPHEERGRWDGARLRQALGNLIGNALQHGAEGAAVTVHLRGATDHVAVTVHNRGTVILADQLDGIFNPMKTRRAPRPGVALGPVGGLGLGLYIAERIVHAHDGHIDVDSSEAEGTSFTIHLPRQGLWPSV